MKVSEEGRKESEKQSAEEARDRTKSEEGTTHFDHDVAQL